MTEKKPLVRQTVVVLLHNRRWCGISSDDLIDDVGAVLQDDSHPEAHGGGKNTFGQHRGVSPKYTETLLSLPEFTAVELAQHIDRGAVDILSSGAV